MVKNLSLAILLSLSPGVAHSEGLTNGFESLLATQNFQSAESADPGEPTNDEDLALSPAEVINQLAAKPQKRCYQRCRCGVHCVTRSACARMGGTALCGVGSCYVCE
jgi:hypothetical protein